MIHTEERQIPMKEQQDASILPAHTMREIMRESNGNLGAAIKLAYSYGFFTGKVDSAKKGKEV